MATCFSMPSSIGQFVNKKTTTVTEILDSATIGVDSMVNSVFKEDIKPMEKLMNGTDAEF